MPWLETAPVEQRERFVRDERLGLYSMTELCDRYGISRKTGYKWLGRFDEGGRKLAEMKKNLRDVPQKCHKLVESGKKRDVEKPATARESIVWALSSVG